MNKFETRAEKSWHLRGIDLPLKVISGRLEEFKNLKDEISSYGLVVYGKYQEAPERIEHKVLVTYELKNLSQKMKMSFLRKLFGYVSVKKGKKYVQEGLPVVKIGANAVLVDDFKEVKKLLISHKIKYKVRDVWM